MNVYSPVQVDLHIKLFPVLEVNLRIKVYSFIIFTWFSIRMYEFVFQYLCCRVNGFVSVGYKLINYY